MDNTRKGLIIAGAVMMVASALVPILFWTLSPGGWQDMIMAVVATVVLGPIVFFTGLALLIAGVVKGKKSQQQQQQVVMMSKEQARAQGFVSSASCPRCGEALGGDEAYCIGCGVKLAHG